MHRGWSDAYGILLAYATEVIPMLPDQFDNIIPTLLSLDSFWQIAHNRPISLLQFNLLTDQLVRLEIPYDISFVPGTRKTTASFQLTIHINPTRTEVFVVSLTPGASVFTPSP